MLNRPFLELSRVFLLRDLFHLLPPKSNVNCTSPLEDYLSGEAQNLYEEYPILELTECRNGGVLTRACDWRKEYGNLLFFVI